MATHISNLISQDMEKVREECVITVKEKLTIEDEIEIIKGMQFNYGYILSIMPKPNILYWIQEALHPTFGEYFSAPRYFPLPQNHHSVLSPTDHHRQE